jgi:hypothetical protein
MSLDERQMRDHLASLFDGLEGYVALGVGFGGHFNGNANYGFKTFSEGFHPWPEQADTLVAKALAYAAQADVFVCPLLRAQRSRKHGTGRLGRFAWADLDAEPAEGWSRMLLGPSSFVVGSGHGQHVYLWMPEPLPAPELEHWNRRLGRTLDADAGWSETKYLRLAGTLNHKGRARGGESAPVAFLDGLRAPCDWAPVDLNVLLLGDPEEGRVAAILKGEEPDAQELRERLPQRVLACLDEEPNGDRSRQTASFVNLCRAERYSDADILALARLHRPTQEKYGPRAEGEVARLLQKVPVPATPAEEQAPRIMWERLADVEVRSIVFRDKPLLQADAFHLFTGRKGVGKGTLLVEIAARVTRGELGERRNVVWIGSEDSAAIDIKPRVLAAGGDPERILIVKEGWIQLPRDIDEITRAITKFGDVGMLVIDPIGNHIAGLKSDSETDIRVAIGQLNKVADDHQCMVFGVRHLTEKECSRGALAAILGSSAWVQVPRVVLAVVRDDGDPQVSHVQCLAGNRLPLDKPGRMFRIEGVLLPGLEEEVTRAVWIGDSTKDAGTLLAAAGKSPSKTDKAKELILDILEAEGEQESDPFDARIAKETGLTARTVQNARVELGHEWLIKSRPEKDETNAVKRWFVYRTTAQRP